MNKIKRCLCCDKVIDSPMGGQKYCLSCSLYTKELRAKCYLLKSVNKALVKKCNKLKRGSERW